MSTTRMAPWPISVADLHPLIGNLPSVLSCATPKRWFEGAERACAPEQTLARVRPHFRKLGITRLADITGLDCIGLPVAQAIRPMSRSLSVKQGKGRSLAAAFTSAAMEATEAWHAEHIPAGVFGALRPGISFLDPGDLTCGHEAPLPNDPALQWCVGYDLIGARAISVPRDLVCLDFTVAKQAAGFQKSSNGLASGNTLAEAAVAALCEVIERDCIANFDALPAGRRQNRYLSQRAIHSHGCSDLTARILNAGLAIDCWDISNSIGIPAFKAAIYAVGPPGRAGYVRAPQHGFGCHLNPAIALSRAITEAAQSRLVLIAGSRDDLKPEDYLSPSSGNLPRFLMSQALAISGQATESPLENRSTGTSEGDLRCILDLMVHASCTTAALFDLTAPDIGIPVVRAVVPGLGRLLPGEKSEPGRRQTDEVHIACP